MPLHMKLHKIIYLRSTNNSVFVYVENEYYSNLCGKWLAYFKLISETSHESMKRSILSILLPLSITMTNNVSVVKGGLQSCYHSGGKCFNNSSTSPLTETMPLFLLSIYQFMSTRQSLYKNVWKTKKMKEAKVFNLTFRYWYDALSISNST